MNSQKTSQNRVFTSFGPLYYISTYVERKKFYCFSKCQNSPKNFFPSIWFWWRSFCLVYFVYIKCFMQTSYSTRKELANRRISELNQLPSFLYTYLGLIKTMIGFLFSQLLKIVPFLLDQQTGNALAFRTSSVAPLSATFSKKMYRWR